MPLPLAGLALGALAPAAARAAGRIIGSFGGSTATATVGTLARPAIRGGSALLSRTGTTIAGRGAVGVARRGALIAGGGAAFELGSRALPGGASFPGGDLSPTFARNFGGGGGGGDLPQPGMNFGTTYVTKTWTTDPNTGFPFFMQLADGRVVVTRRDGSLKSYRPTRPIVLSRKPTIKQAVRAMKVMNRIRNDVKKEFRLKERD